MISTDSALFSWEHELDLLQGSNQELLFRITERPRQGSKAMLPLSLRSLIAN